MKFDEWLDESIAGGGITIRDALLAETDAIRIAKSAWCAAMSYRDDHEEAMKRIAGAPVALTEQEIADLIYQHTGLSQQQFPDEYADSLKLVKAALAQQPQCEVVAWVRRGDNGELRNEFIWDEAIEPARRESGAWLPLVLAAPPQAAPAHNTERKKYIARAVAAWGGVWPAQLESGVMFYEGERITRAEFEGKK